MKWKDSEAMTNEEEKPKEEFFDEEQYSPWADRKDPKKITRLNKMSLMVVLPAVAIVVLVIALLMILWGGKGDPVTRETTAALEERVRLLEERVGKFEAIDEKVTRIWEQAQSFEKFTDRFDRGEASTSLRMDHLTMSMEALQKQFNDVRKASVPASKASVKKATSPTKNTASTNPKAVEKQYHQVAAGDTLYSISKKHGISVKELLKINQMGDNSVLKIGQKLIVRAQ